MAATKNNIINSLYLHRPDRKRTMLQFEFCKARLLFTDYALPLYAESCNL
jgi:hypothetical protein